MSTDMTRSRAVEFLRDHQPMLPDDRVTKSDIEELDLVRRFLKAEPAEEALPLLLGVFGDGSGFGVYQLIEDAVAAYPATVVTSALQHKLETGSRSVRYWCAQIAAAFPDECYVPQLVRALDPGDRDLRSAAVTALEAVGSDDAMDALRGWLPRETDEELQDAIREICG